MKNMYDNFNVSVNMLSAMRCDLYEKQIVNKEIHSLKKFKEPISFRSSPLFYHLKVFRNRPDFPEFLTCETRKIILSAKPNV